jgi:hypothetical protein
LAFRSDLHSLSLLGPANPGAMVGDRLPAPWLRPVDWSHGS